MLNLLPLPNAIITKVGNCIYAVMDLHSDHLVPIRNNLDLLVLRALAQRQNTSEAYNFFRKIAAEGNEGRERLALDSWESQSDGRTFYFYCGDRILVCRSPNNRLLPALFNPAALQRQVEAMSAEMTQLHHQQIHGADIEHGDYSTISTIESFEQAVLDLVKRGLASPAVGSINWGNFAQPYAVGHVFGLFRGTSVDRFYLKLWAETLRPHVTGRVLDIGGGLQEKERYQFTNAQEYRTLNLPGSGDDIIGNAEDPNAIAPESFDCIIAFNLLEHCPHPWVVIDNCHRWLRQKGKLFCQVPAAQRLHGIPGDYWRIMPSGLQNLLHKFSNVELKVFGNPVSLIASFHGVVIEELDKATLLEYHPDYPVTVCATATK